MGAMKEIYTETLDLRDAALELDAEAFNTYVEQMGWRSSTEMQAVRRTFAEKAAAGMTLLYLQDAGEPSAATVTAAKIMDAAVDALGIDRDTFMDQLKEDVFHNVILLKNGGEEGVSGE